MLTGAALTRSYGQYPSSATGSYTVSRSGNNIIYTFTGSGTFTPSLSLTANLLVVGGGGGGGGTAGATNNFAGGGGAGGVVAQANVGLTAGTQYTATVGAGGTGGSSGIAGGNGGDSAFGTYTATGGGGGGSTGGSPVPRDGKPGGSGGGGASDTVSGAGGGGTSNQGNSGYSASDGTRGGGGGGAGAAANYADGGGGLASSISGASVTYACGGGGGASTLLTVGAAGCSGGGKGACNGTGVAASPNTGCGGGGGGTALYSSSPEAGGAGGSGIVIVSYPVPTYTVTASAGANGSISPSGTTTVNYGASQTYTITPATNYVISDVQVDGSSVGVTPSYTLANVNANHNIAASFAPLSATSTATGAFNAAEVGSSAVYEFTNSGTFTPAVGMTANLLIVGGGGGGGGAASSSSCYNLGGGGGAGGVIATGLVLTANNAYTVSVGAGGSPGTYSSAGGNGGDSAFGTNSAKGGGGGGSAYSASGAIGLNGGSGGGGARYNCAVSGNGGTGTSQQGTNGAAGASGLGGGGGGAGAAGGTDGYNQDGGAGRASSITGTSVTYAGGGGGAAIGGSSYPVGRGGAGGGGAGSATSPGSSGEINKGGGGGGGSNSGGSNLGTGGAGGSGIVIISYSLKDTPTVNWPAASAITYGQALSASTLSGGNASTAGTFAFASPGTIPAAAGNYSAAITFTPADTSTYNAAVGNVNVIVSPAGTTCSIATSPNPALPTDTITFTATVTSSGPIPTGTVQFRSNGRDLNGAVPLNASGQAQASVIASSLGHGGFAVSASYVNSDGNFTASIGALASNQVVNQPPTAASPTCSRAPSISLKIPVSALGTDADGDVLEVSALGPSEQGATLSHNATWVFYLPASGNDNPDTFGYTISDGYGGSASGTVTVSVVRQGAVATQITYTESGVVISFAGIPGYWYDVQRDSDAQFTCPTVITTTQAPPAGVFTVPDCDPLNPAGYYRLMQH